MTAVRDFWKPLTVPYRMAAVLLILFLGIAFFAPALAPYDPNAVSTGEILQYSSPSHLLGTDALGRDTLSRLLYGARFSVSFAAMAAVCTMIVGVLLGAVGGYFGGLPDRCIQALVALIQGLPGMSLMIAIAALLPEGNLRILIAVTVTSWAGISRIVRSEVIRVKNEPYIEGIRCLGGSPFYILRCYILPNVMPVAVVLLTLRIGSSLLSASALSYLGLGVTPPTADWGVMINNARAYFRSYPLMIIAPGSAITLFCICVNLIGDAFRKHWTQSENDRWMQD